MENQGQLCAEINMHSLKSPVTRREMRSHTVYMTSVPTNDLVSLGRETHRLPPGALVAAPTPLRGS